MHVSKAPCKVILPFIPGFLSASLPPRKRSSGSWGPSRILLTETGSRSIRCSYDCSMQCSANCPEVTSSAFSSEPHTGFFQCRLLIGSRPYASAGAGFQKGSVRVSLNGSTGGKYGSGRNEALACFYRGAVGISFGNLVLSNNEINHRIRTLFQGPRLLVCWTTRAFNFTFLGSQPCI